MSFIKFELKKAVRVGEPSITISPQGIFYYNASMIKQHVKDKQKVAYHYDPATKRVGFDFINRTDNATYIVQRPKNSGAGFSSAKAFFHHHNIDYSHRTVYTVEYDNRYKLYVIDLTKPVKK